MGTSKPEAGQWWVPDAVAAGSKAIRVAVFIVGQTTEGRTIYQCNRHSESTDLAEDEERWSHWHHEPRCTGWDWVVPEDPTPPANQPDPDEWVVQDRVPVRVGDSAWWVNAVYSLPSSPEQMQVVDIADEEFQKGLRHGSKHPRVSNTTLYVMCRRRDLPHVEQCAACDAPAEPGTAGCRDCNEYATAICSPEPEQWPKYYETLTHIFPDAESAYVERVSHSHYRVIYKDGSRSAEYPWIPQDESRKPLTEAEAMALLKKPDPQPAKTRVRLWLEGPTKMIMCRDKAPYGDWQEIHHDAEGFYVLQASH